MNKERKKEKTVGEKQKGKAVLRGMDHSTSIALDRDATRVIRISLLPASLPAPEKRTSWLFIHRIPVTISLSSVLRELLTAQDDARQRHRPFSSGTSGSNWPALPSSEWIEVVRIAYVVSEIHSYCFLLKCTSPLEAEKIKQSLEKLTAAPGVNMPVDFMTEEAWLEEDGGGGEPVPVDLLQTLLVSSPLEEGMTVSPSPSPSLTPSRSPLLAPMDSVIPLPPQIREALREEVCPICQVEPLTAAPCLVTLCQHRFHVRCYAQLPIEAADCPMCRFSLYDLLNDAKCEECCTFEDLWVCLICGFVGCGRGRKGHSNDHFEVSGHSCAMQMRTNRIWNFKSHLFLHQEVAILLGEDSSVEADPSGAGAAARHMDFDWTGDGREEERNLYDDAVQTAMEESRENAVLGYYSNLLQELLQEQRRWYESQQRERWAALHPSTATTVSAAVVEMDGGFDSVEAILLAEHHHRAYIVSCYLKETEELAAQSVEGAFLIGKQYRQRQTSIKEELLLLQHTIDGLQHRRERIGERLSEAKEKRKQNQREKEQLIEELQRRIQTAFE